MFPWCTRCLLTNRPGTYISRFFRRRRRRRNLVGSSMSSDGDVPITYYNNAIRFDIFEILCLLESHCMNRLTRTSDRSDYCRKSAMNSTQRQTGAEPQKLVPQLIGEPFVRLHEMDHVTVSPATLRVTMWRLTYGFEVAAVRPHRVCMA